MRMLFVFAHPDDESFLCGGTIAQLSKTGHEIKLITATFGEMGSVGNPPITTQDKLGKVREKEHQKAAKILGISQIYYLGYLDGALKNIPQKELESKILKLFEKEKPDIVVTFDKAGDTNHPDHIAISRATTLAFKTYASKSRKHVKLYYSVNPRSQVQKLEKLGFVYDAFGKVLGVPDQEITNTINIEDTFETKIKALKEHKTQHQDLERYLVWCEHINLKKEHFQLILENHTLIKPQKHLKSVL